MIKSPCIDVCTLDETGEVCLGCERTVQEIVAWVKMTEEEKKIVLLSLEERRKKRSLTFSK